ncbi:MAG TPA: protein kinase [Planctomycetota bacterium]|nr:protein kinase [Planctomycetota bacterium]
MDPDDGGQQLLLGKMLLERGLITPDQLREALVERARSVSDSDGPTTPLGGILVRKGYLTDEQLLGLMAEQNGDGTGTPHPQGPSGSAPATSAPTLPALTVPDILVEEGHLGKYKLLKELGRGGMGVVYEALDTQLNRKVALKLMLTNPNADPKDRALEEERFVQEAQLSAKLKHPNIVTVYEAGLLDGRQFLSMEMIEGLAFNEWRKTVTIRQQIQVVADVAGAVHHAHEQGILHRDLKPRNILVSDSGHSYVTDFGLAKSLGKNVHQSLTGSGAVVGTPAYMSPEQAQGLDRVDWRTDIYSLGVILYECMTGRTPFTGESPIEILMKVVKDPVPPPLQLVDPGSALGLDKGIENICLKALAKKDRDRYVTAQAFSDDINKWLAGEKVNVSIPRSKGKRDRKVFYIAVGLLLLLAAGLTFLGVTSARYVGKQHLDAAKRFMAEGEYSEAMIQFRVILANDPGNQDAALGLKTAQDALSKKDREREEKLKNSAIEKFRESEEKQMRALTLLRQEQEADSEEKRKELGEKRRQAEIEARLAKELADKAEAEFRISQSYVITGDGVVGDSWKDAINLLPMVDPRRNAILGSWDLQDAGRLTSDRGPNSRVEIPFQLPAEYDFQMVFERRTGSGAVSVIFSKGGRQFRLELGGEANTRAAFEVQPPGKELELPAFKTEQVFLQNDVKYTVQVQVRSDGVKAQLNDKQILHWATDFRDIGLNPAWKLRNTLRLGIGSNESEIVFHRLALLEVTGKGRKQEYTPGPPFKAQVVPAASLKPGLIGEYYLGTGFQSLAVRRNDAALEFRWGDGAAWPGGPTDSFSARWSGYLHVPRTARYTFHALADDGVRLFIDDQQILASWTSRTDSSRIIDCALEEGYHRIVVEYFELAWQAAITLSWTSSPSQPPLPIPPKSFFHNATEFQNFFAPQKLPELVGMVPGHSQNVNAIAFDPSGKLAAVAGEDRRVRFIEIPGFKEQVSSVGHPAGVLCVAYSPDGAQFATGSRDNRVRIWDAQNRAELRTLEGPTSFVQALAYAPDGKRLACGSYDRSVRLWTLESQDEPKLFEGHTGGVETMGFSRDGKLLATAGLDHTVRLWDVDSGTLEGVLQGHADFVEAIVFSPGGRTLATAGADGLIKLWDFKSRRELKVLAGHGEDVMSLAFSPDGLTLAAGSNDGMIRVWDPVNGRLIKVIPGHTARVSSLAFAPSGRLLASASADATVRFWNIDR